MVLVVKLIGIAILLMAMNVFVKPDVLKQIMAYVKQGKRVYISIVLKMVVGILFLKAAADCRVSGFITLMGVLMVLGPAIFLFLGQERINKYLAWWEEKPKKFYRIWAVCAVVLGVLIIFSA